MREKWKRRKKGKGEEGKKIERNERKLKERTTEKWKRRKKGKGEEGKKIERNERKRKKE